MVFQSDLVSNDYMTQMVNNSVQFLITQLNTVI